MDPLWDSTPLEELRDNSVTGGRKYGEWLGMLNNDADVDGQLDAIRAFREADVVLMSVPVVNNGHTDKFRFADYADEFAAYAAYLNYRSQCWPQPPKQIVPPVRIRRLNENGFRATLRKKR